MAYVIGSQKGKDIAKGMKSGETYKASDGSTWTKKSDGSVSVTHNGQTFNNAYTPSSTGGSSSGGSSKSSNSPYSGGSLDYSVLGQQQMANGASWQDVQNTLDNRVNKALNTSGLEQYAYDDKYWAMYNYIQNQKKASNTTAGDILSWNNDYNQDNERPTQPQRDPRIDALLNEILTRDKFSYDVASDPLYQQYANMYQREGDRAMKETLAEAAAGAGGMNTYAITAAQQANSYYNSQLNDRIPELYQLAYNMYLQDIEGQVRDLGLLERMDATQYSRYRDTINDWYNDKNFAYGTFQDAVQQGNWQTNFDYNDLWKNKEFNYNDMWKNKEWDYNDMWANKEWDYNDEWKNKEWDTTQEDKEYERNQYDQETAKAEVWKYIELGITPSADLIKRAGMTESDVNLAVAAVKAEQAKKSTSTSGGGGYTGGGKDEGKEKKKVEEDDGIKYIGESDITDDGNDAEESIGIGEGISSSNVLSLGIGPIGDEALLNHVKSGAVILNADGTVQWANGYNKNNYQDALNKLYTGIYPTLQF